MVSTLETDFEEWTGLLRKEEKDMNIRKKRTMIAASIFLCFLMMTFTFAMKYHMISDETEPRESDEKATSDKRKESAEESEDAKAESEEPQTKTSLKAEADGLVPEYTEHRAGEFVFTFTIDDFIDGYNGIYRADKGKEYLAPSWEWRTYNYDRAIHSEYESSYYNYSKEETILPFPTISVYTPLGSDQVQEIMLNFDDHSYTEPLYRAYEDICFYTLKTLLPDLAHEEIVTLYTTLNDLAYENLTQVNYTSESVPCVLYCRENVALYPYFAIGESLHLCIIPAAQRYVEEMRDKGTEIINF